ncbi:MAG: response regulator transcription factor [Bacteroidaceae bacterium]|nr:response regulator transcription factor [Bacteroidaceae bacterium]
MLHAQIHPELAIIDPNTFSQMGLKNLLVNIIPQVTVRCFSSFTQLMDDTPDMYSHYFVASTIVMEHTAFFLDRKERCIVMVNGVSNTFNNFHTLDTSLKEKDLVRALLCLHEGGHKQHLHPMSNEKERDKFRLSPREIEVLTLIVRGLINKEIADRLNISLTTVISHRKNITEKLGIRSVSGLTIYAVINGLVEANQI